MRGFLTSKFDDYRNEILNCIKLLGYKINVSLLNSSDFHVPQLRPRAVIVAIREDIKRDFKYPEKCDTMMTVGKCLKEEMGSRGWKLLNEWVDKANKVAPTIVGGSKKHGGPDLGPVRARRQWAEIGIDGMGVANEPPDPNFVGMPRLTKKMIALLQGFPPHWDFGDKKTKACRMIGNAFPPPVAKAIGIKIRECLDV